MVKNFTSAHSADYLRITALIMTVSTHPTVRQRRI